MPYELSNADLTDYLLTRMLLKRLTMKITNRSSAKYDSEINLWNDLSKSNLSDSQNIILEKFNVMEWIPRSPGLYHTKFAASERRNASGFVTEMFDRRYVYEPYGKLAMVRGGVGCLRLLPKEVGGETMRFLCATNSGVVHKGFVIAMKQDIFSKIDDQLQNTGAFSAKLKGEIRYLFENQDDIPVYWGDKIPRAYLLIEDLSDIGPPEPDKSLDVTAAVTFGMKEAGYLQEPKFTYSHFDPTKNHDIEKCVDWIEKAYVQEYQNGVVLTDFDEKQSHFTNTVFPISDLMNPNLTRESLSEFFNKLNIKHNEHISKVGNLIVT